MGELDIPNHYNKTEIDALVANINLSNYYNTTEIDTLFENIDLSNYFTKAETHATYYDKIAMDSLLANQIYTDSENINITNNQISLTFPLKVNGEIVMNPRAYGIQFEIYAGTSGVFSTESTRWRTTSSHI